MIKITVEEDKTRWTITFDERSVKQIKQLKKIYKTRTSNITMLALDLLYKMVLFDKDPRAFPEGYVEDPIGTDLESDKKQRKRFKELFGMHPIDGTRFIGY